MHRMLSAVQSDIKATWAVLDRVGNGLVNIEQELQDYRLFISAVDPAKLSPEARLFYAALMEVLDICRSHGLDV